MAETLLDELIAIDYNASVQEGGWTVTMLMDGGQTVSARMPIRIQHQDYWEAAASYGQKTALWDATETYANSFQGHVIRAQKVEDWEGDTLQVVAAGAQAFMRDYLTMRPLNWREKASPSGDNEFVTMRFGDIVKALVEDYTTLDSSPGPAYTVTEIDNTAGSTYSFYGTGASNLFQIIRELADIEAKEFFVKKNKSIFYDIHPMFEATPPAKIVTLTADYWFEIAPIRRQTRVKEVRLTCWTDGSQAGEQDLPRQAVYVSGNTEGEIIQKTIAGNDQAQLTNIATRMGRFRDREWDVEITTWHLWGFELGDRVGITYSDTQLGIAWSDKDFYVDSIHIPLRNSPPWGWTCDGATVRFVEAN